MIGAAACGHGYDGKNEGEGGEEAVLGIRDILVRIRIPGSIPLTNDPDPRFRIQLRIRLLSSVTLRMQKINFFHIFSYNLPKGTLC